jgi:hypothetical protein
MPVIKYTLSQDRRLRSNDPQVERAWLARAHELHYALPTRPRRVQAGDYVYFIHAGKMKARAVITRVLPGKSRRTYTHRIRPAAPFDLEVAAPMEIAKRYPNAKGFQGFQYLSASEAARFARAFI